MTSIRIVGVYRVPFTESLFEETLKAKWPEIFDADQTPDLERRKIEEEVRKELGSIVILEIIVENVGRSFSLDGFCQKGSDQRAYEERYLSDDGTIIVSKYRPPPGNHLRIAFFLHYFDPSFPLETPFGVISLPAPAEELPPRIAGLMSYQPVD